MFLTSGSPEDGTKVGKDKVIEVNVEWDDFEGSFELHNSSN